MSDLISRQALCDDLREYKVHPVPISSDESEVKGYNDGIDLAISVISEFPSAEPKRKRGKWVNGMLYHDFDESEWEKVKCSVCENFVVKQIFYNNNNKYRFCPNCGADMTRGE